jgi:hypothetical protein
MIWIDPDLPYLNTHLSSGSHPTFAPPPIPTHPVLASATSPWVGLAVSEIKMSEPTKDQARYVGTSSYTCAEKDAPSN